MKDFTFDLQRFAATWEVNGETKNSLSAAVSAASAGDTITLQSGGYSNGFTINKSVIIDLGGYTFTIRNGSAPEYAYTEEFTTGSGATVTFQNGTLNRANSGAVIAATGSINIIDLTTSRNVSSSSGTVTVSGDSSIKAGNSTYILANGVKLKNTTAGSMTLTTNSDKSASVVLNSGNTLTATESDTREVVYKAIGSAITFNYSAAGKASVTNLLAGSSFSVAVNGESAVTYYVNSNGCLRAECDGTIKVSENTKVTSSSSFNIDDLDFDDDDLFTTAILTNESDNTTLTISNSLDIGDTLKVIDYNNYAKNYGYLQRPDSSTYSLTKENDNNSSLSGITVNDGLTVKFDSAFKGIPITATNSATKFKSLTDGVDFSLSSTDLNGYSTLQAASITGDVAVSLISGSIKSATTNPTINAGSYWVSSVSGGDGVAVIANDGQTLVSGIDVGESFYVKDVLYTRDNLGLRTGDGLLKSYTSDIATLSANDKSISIDISKLETAAKSFIDPANNVMEIGSEHYSNAVIVDDADSPSVRYAELLVDGSSTLGNAYSLRAGDGGNAESFVDAVNTISLTGGTNVVIDTDLVKNSAKTVAIAAGSGNTPDATFKVTAVTGDTFTVSLKTSSAATTISDDATAITLISGTIKALAGQTITLDGVGGRVIYVDTSSSGMEVTINTSTGTNPTTGEEFTVTTATIKANKNDKFTIDGKEFTVDSKSDGMTFTVTESNIIAGGLTSADNDGFTYGDATYSVRGAGFVMTDTAGAHSLWTDDSNNHSISNGTVTIENLFADDHTWNPLATVKASDNSATLPPDKESKTVTLVGNDFAQTFGVLTNDGGTACTLTTGSSNSNEAKLSKISVSSDIDSFNFGAGLTDISLISDIAKFIVTTDDSVGGYQVTVTSDSSGNTSAVISGATWASLISGTVQADDSITVQVLDKGFSAGEGDKITLSTDGTAKGTKITAMEVGEQFSMAGSGNYVMSEVGLVDSNKYYLPGTRAGNPIILASLTSSSVWGGLIDRDSITINATTPTALIVDFDGTDDEGNPYPVTLYADHIYDSTKGTHSFVKSNSADDWDDDIVINIANTTASFSSYFKDKKIAGVNSDAEFTVTDDKAFTVTDTLSGAVIGSATNISQTAGTINLASGQTILSDAGTISSGGTKKNITFAVDGSDATIGSFDVNDVFTFTDSSSTSVTYTKNDLGVVTSDDRLFTAYTIDSSVTVADLLTGTEAEGGNWTNTIYISNNIVSIPPSTSGTSPWIILNNNTNKSIRYGTLAEANDGGYSVTKSSLDTAWPTGTTFNINDESVTFTKDFSGRRIYGKQSGASITVADATGDFKFSDSSSGAIISGTGSTKVNQRAGLVSPQVGQTIVAGTGSNYSIAAISSDDAINISVSGTAATINAISEGDEFSINGHTYEVLTDGVILRDDSEIWKDGTVGTSATAAALTTAGNWYGLLPISAEMGQDLVINSSLVGSLSNGSYFIVDEDNHNQIYGKLIKTNSGNYELSTTNANVTENFKTVTVSTDIENITFAKDYFITNSIPITAGDATFVVTDEDTSSFTVNYSYKTSVASVKNTDTIALTNGKLAFDTTNSSQTITALASTVKRNSGTITATVDKESQILTVGGLSNANDSVDLNGETYTYVSGNGMTITVADSTTKFTNLDDDDKFTIGEYTYTKTAKGLIKQQTDSDTAYMYMGSISDVTENGIDVKVLKSVGTEYWQPIAAVTDGEILIDSSSKQTVVLVGSLTNPTENIYGTLIIEGSTRTLTKDGGANTVPASITVDGVTVTINSDFGAVSIIPTNSPTINTSDSDGQLTFKPASGATFTVNDTTYVMTDNGLTSGGRIWVREDKTYTLPNESAPWGINTGTVTLKAGDSVTLSVAGGTTISVESGEITASAENSVWTKLGGLTSGDVFSIGDSTYKVLSDGKTVGLYDANKKVTKIYAGIADDGTINHDDIVSTANYGNVLTLTDGVLDLTSIPSWTTASVFGSTDEGDPDPTKNVATVNYSSSSGYELADPGKSIGELTSINLGDVKTFKTKIIKPVITPASGTYTVNGKSFVAANTELEITPTEDGSAILTGGTATLTAGNDVTTASCKIEATTGTITVNVDDSTVKIGNLTDGKVFSVDGTSYTMAALGVKKSEDTLLYVDDDKTITVEKLKGEWETICEAENGALTISSTTPDSAAVVDSSNAVKYGTITKSATDSIYTYTKTDSNLTSVTINGVAASIPATTIPITANGATFKASGDITVDATTTIPTITATAITLTAGTINAPLNDIPVTVNNKKIIATNNSAITIGLDGTSIKIGALDVGDTFSIDGIEYTMTGTGLYIAASGQVITKGFLDNDGMKTYTVGDYDTDNVVVLESGVLNLTAKPASDYSAIVVYKADTDTEVDITKKVAKVDYSATDDCYTLSEQGNYFSQLSSVSLSAVNVFNTELNTTVTTPESGTYIINGSSFTAVGTDTLKIKTATDSATLTGGTVSLAAGAEVLTPKGTITANSSNTAAITVNVDDSTVTIDGLENGRAFDFGGKTYTKTSIGLNDTTLLLTLDGTSVTTDKLGTGATMLAATDGKLEIDTSATGTDWVVVDSTSAPVTNYGTLTKSGSNYSFTQNTALKSITAGGATFQIDGDFTVNLTSTPKISGASAVTLNSGTIAAPNIPVTVNGRVITTETDSGEQMTVAYVDDKTQVGGLDTGDTFKIGETTYELTSAGLYDAANNLVITNGLSDDRTTFTIGDNISYTNVVALKSGVLDLTEKPAVGYTALIVSETGNLDPTKKVATVTYDGTKYTLSDKGTYFSELQSVSLNAVTSFNTDNLSDTVTITTPESGTYIINGSSFTAVGTDTLKIKTATDSSTLTGGTVSLAAGAEVLTPKGTITANLSNTAAITVNVDDSTVTIDGLENGRAFDFGGKTYTKTSIGLNDTTLLLTLNGTSVTTDKLGTGTTMLAATDGKLEIDTSATGTDWVVVDSTSAPATNYGTLTKSGSNYSFTQNTSLKSITAGGATFQIDGDFTVNLTSTPKISGATAVTLNSGTIAAPNIPVTVNGRVITTETDSGEQMTVAYIDDKTQVGGLDTGDTFKIGETTYELTSAGLYDAANNLVITNGLSDDRTTFTIGDNISYTNVVALKSGVLDLTEKPAVGYTALIVSETGNLDPTKKVATVTYDGTKYTLSDKGTYFSELQSVTLNAVTSFNTDNLSDTVTITTPESGTYTINGTSFTAKSALTIETNSSGETLTDGTISLTKGAEVLTPKGTITAASGNSAAITVDVNNSTVTVGELENGKAFDFDSKTYTKTSIGLTEDGTKLIDDAGSTITTDELSGGATIISATGGKLTVDENTVAGAIVDLTNPTNAIKYGTLTKDSSGYTFEQNTALTSITLNGVRATFPATTATFKANDATFTAGGSLTVDASSDIPSLSGATSVTLTAGTINAPSNIAVTVGTGKITTTTGNMTIGLSSGKAVVGNLIAGDTFNVGSRTYKVSSEGELFSDKQIVTNFADNTFVVDDATYTDIIAPSGTTLNLNKSVSDGSYLVYASDTNPTKRLAELEVKGSSLDLNGTDDNTITTVNTASGANLTVDFAATVNGSGSTTVNGEEYAGTGDLTIYATADSSALFKGNINLTSASNELKLTNDSSTLKINNGTVTAQVAGGAYDKLSNLAQDDSFDYNGTTYTQTKLGMVSGGTVAEKLAGSTVAISDLESAQWSAFLYPVNGTLDLQGVGNNSVVYDNPDNPSKKLATLNLSNGKLILNGASNAAKDITTILIDNGANLTVDFTTQINATQATVNGSTFNGTSTLTIDAKSKAATLYAGTVTLNSANPAIKPSSGSSISTTGTINATAALGKFVEVSDLGTGESFTFGDNTYTLSSFGLVTGGTIAQNLTSSTVDLDTLSSAKWETFIAPKSGTLDLSKVKAGCVVFNDITNPSMKLADLTVDGSNFTLAGTSDASAITTVGVAKDTNLTVRGFDTKVNAPIGSVTVNGQGYDAASDAVINTAGTTSTLTKGKVNIAPAASVTTTSARTVANAGDKAITLDANGSTLTVGNLVKNSVFDVDDKEYMITSAALFRTANAKDAAAANSTIYTGSADVFGGSITVAQLDADTWGNLLEVPASGTLTVDSDSDSGSLISSDLEKFYGSLTKSAGGYTLTKSKANAGLTAIKVDGVALNMAGDFAKLPLTAGDSSFSGLTLSNSNTFTLDATDTVPGFSNNVTALKLETGTVAASASQTVTAGNNVIIGDVVITNGDTVTISEIGAGETFKLNGKEYKSTTVGLINLDDSALVTSGFADSALNVDTMRESKFIGAVDGVLDLTTVKSGAPVFDSKSNPTKQIGTLTVADGKLTLGGTEDIKTVKVATDSDLTLDFAAQVEAPKGSVTVNGKSYLGTTALTLQSDGTTSTLSKGTVSLSTGENVTVGENLITATAGDGLTVTAGDNVTINGLNDGDKFTVDGTTYTICAAGLISGDELFTGGDYSRGVTLENLDNNDNWTRMQLASYGAFAVDAGTLEDGGEVILVDSITNPTKTYGTLNKFDGEYLLMKYDKADAKLSAITVAGTIISIDTELADVPITTVNADASESIFTVKPTAGAITFRVDATGKSPKIDGVDEVDIIKGKIVPQDGQIIKPADGGDEKDITISYGNGEHKIGDKTVIVDGLNDGDTVDFELDENGNIKKITGLPKGATITIDGTTYTSPFDDATLTYTDEDGWYFDGWTLDEYTVTIDADGNIKVDTGIRFRNVISSGRKLGDDGTIQLSGERGDSSVKIINGSGIALKVNDSDASTLAENLGAQDGVTFSTAGVAADNLQAVAGATINLGEGQSLTAGDDTSVTAKDGAKVEVDENSINVNGAAQIEAPADTELNLGAGDYSVNGVDFKSGEKTQATATDTGVEFNLADSTGLTYDGMNLTGDGAAAVNSDGAVTLTDGAIADNTTGKTLTVAGKVQLDDKTVNVDSTTEVTATDKGLNVGETELEVEGDDDGYIINIEKGTIIGLENIGNPDGVTVSGLDDASIKSDKAGSLTVGDKTFFTSDNSVTWIDDGQIAEVGDVEGTVKGDFSDGLTVNGENVQVQSDKNSEVEVVADEEGVKAIQATDADKYTINGKKYETEGEIKFNMNGGSVTGVEADDATFAIGQNETDFTVNDETLNLTQNSKPVTLGVSNGAISAVYGVDGAIGGLSNATVYDLTRATVNGIALDISGSIFDASIQGGTLSSIVGIDPGSTINSAPDLRIITSGDGSFTFGGKTYHVSDTVDSSVTFMTDANSNLTAINDFAGEVSGAVTSLNLNGKDFGTNNGKVTVASDGENITRIDGVKSGDSIGGDIDKASFTMPEGKISINGGEFILEDNGGDAAASNGGKIITGIAKDASLTVGADGSYQVNGRSAAASAGGVFTVNRDGSYLINPNFLPIIEKTPSSEILGRSGGGLELVSSNGTIGAGKDSVAVRNGAQVVIQGEPLIVATSGSVTLENYTGAASIGTFEYLYIGNAIKSNSIQFGDGVMTLGDAVITFEENAGSVGATRAQLLNAQGREQKIGFTHTAGGTINAANETANLVLKGNYANSANDTQKSGNSNLVGGSGDDMLLIGGGDTANAGGGNNQIYLTNSNLRELGAMIIFGGGTDTVHNFNGGYTSASDLIIISDLNAIEFSAGASDLVMRSGNSTLTFSNMSKRAQVTLSESSDAASVNDGSYRVMLNDGSTTYNAAIAQAGKNIVVTNGDLANVFYGNGGGVNFSEYTGAVAVNLNDGAGNVGGSAAQFNGIDKLTGGAGNSSLTGAENVSNTLTAGTGDGIIWSNSGNDLMVGNTSATKTGFTTFNYLEGDEQDTITGFDFAKDWIDITTANEVTSVSVSGSNVVMYINESETDYLTLAQGVGKNFRINNLTAQVNERTLEFDGLANCFVATASNATLNVGADVTEAEIWLSDGKTSVHGSYYLGDITVLDASKSAGSLILVGNDLNNTILGGAGENSIYGGLGDDVLIGGDGKNTFFFAMVSGNDVITGAHDGDIIDLSALTAADVAGTAIDGSGTAIALTDGSLLEVRGTAAVEYKTTDGTYIADHATGTWTKK